VALALREDGWYLRSDVIWVKGNALPESVQDRCTRSFEHVFQLTKSKRYYYDYAAIAEPVKPETIERMKHGRRGSHKYSDGIPGQSVQGLNRPRKAGSIPEGMLPTHRNKRDVWLINTVAYAGAHFAAFPPKLVETCILAGCPVGGVVLDPFFGSGTTGLVARQHGRHFVGIEINPRYCELARERTATAMFGSADIYGGGGYG
jgi:DNA modification methylase